MSQAGKYFDGTPLGDLETLTGNTGGPVPGDSNHNINIIGIDGLIVEGDPGTNTLTIHGAVGDLLQSLKGNTGDVVFPDPVTYNINILGANGITIDGDNPTHTLTVDGSAFVRTLTGDNPDAVPPDGAGNINIVGSGGITVTGDIPTNTLTVDGSGLGGGGVIVTVFNASGTWTKNANTKMVYYVIVSSGGGGASGARNAAGVSTSGGGGGGVQGATIYMIPSDQLGATENVTVAAGGAGGAPQVTDNTSGNPGGNSVISYFGTVFPIGGGWLYQSLPGFNIAIGGNTGLAKGGNIGGPTLYFEAWVEGTGPTLAFGGSGNAGAAGGDASTPFVGLNFKFTPTAGGAGGGLNAGNVAFAGGAGGVIGLPTIGGEPDLFIGTAVPGGAAGINGGNGTDATAIDSPFRASGFGAGGGGGHISAPGMGGLGGFPGGGGGGGGAVHNGNPSGAGGDGGDGQVVIYEFLGA